MATRTALIAANVIAVVLIVAAAEIYFRHQGQDADVAAARLEFSNEQPFQVADEDLGIRPVANYATRARYSFGEELIYDVEYTTGPDRLRTSELPVAEEDRPCILFFGGSFTWGVGVNDSETTPALVGAKTGGRYAIRNFGFGGYGPHQMLAAIERGLVEQALAGCRPEIAIYWAIPEHALRSAGRTRADRSGPRFVLQPNGDVVRDGNFSHPAWLSWLEDNVRLAGGIADAAQPTQADLDLFHAIVERARDDLVERYPGLRFYVLYWDLWSPELFADTRPGRDLHRLSQVIPRDRLADYQIPHDGHPNAAAHEVISDYIVEHLVR